MQKTIRQTFRISPQIEGLLLKNLGVIKTRDVKTVHFVLDFVDEKGRNLYLDDKRVFAYVTLGNNDQQFVLESDGQPGVFNFDTSVIQKPCKVRVDVYIEEGEESVDAGAFAFQADISKIDQDIERLLSTNMPSLGELLKPQGGISERVETEKGWYIKLGSDLVLLYQKDEGKANSVYSDYKEFVLDIPIGMTLFCKTLVTPALIGQVLMQDDQFESYEEIAKAYQEKNNISKGEAEMGVASYIMEFESPRSNLSNAAVYKNKLIYEVPSHFTVDTFLILGVTHHDDSKG